MCIPFDREVTMRRRAKLVFGASAAFAALATGLAILAQEAAPRDVERSESALYTRPYKVEENGVVRMSPDCEWRILPRYVGAPPVADSGSWTSEPRSCCRTPIITSGRSSPSCRGRTQSACTASLARSSRRKGLASRRRSVA